MKLVFLGATHEVTGSCFLLEACGKNILIDCGMEQGRDTFENQDIPVCAADIDAILLTHAHIDHSGKLPMLAAQGFRGKIHTTKATASLSSIMLRDCAHIQVAEAEWKNRKRKRSGDAMSVPMYDMEDAMAAVRLFVGHDYGQTFELYDGIRVRFTDVGHLLGSASIEIWITEKNETKKIVFSGDIGNINQPLINDPQYIREADYVVMESTYGDRLHEAAPDYISELTEIIQSTFDAGGNVVIPSFAVGRTQMLLYYLRIIKNESLIKGHENFKVYVDSPLAVEATQLFNEFRYGYYDSDAMRLVRQGINPISFPGLITTITSEESKAINFDDEPKVIISASGMCEAGRIRHHLKHNLWREDSTVLFVGYQAEGTLGRQLLNGASEIRLFGETIRVAARIVNLPGVSGHADRNGLIKWLKSFEKKPDKVFIVHGEDEVCTNFAEYLKIELGYDAYAPYSGTVYDLAGNFCIEEGRPVPAEKKAAKQRTDTVFDKLVLAGKRLIAVIQRNKDGANKDLARFASQINSLCDKWDR